MRKLSKLVVPALFATVALGLATPTMAQDRDYRGDRYEHGDRDYRGDRDHRGDRMHRNDTWRLTPARNAEIRSDIQSLRRAIDRAEARQRISRREAMGLRQDAARIQRLYANYARNGLSWQEVRTLESQVNSVRVALRMERRDWDGRRG